MSTRSAKARAAADAAAAEAAGRAAHGPAHGAQPMDTDGEAGKGPADAGEGGAFQEFLPAHQQTAADPAAMQALARALLAVQAQAGQFHGVEGGGAAQGAPALSPQYSPASSPRGGPQPRLADLPDYDGASGAKLDDWLANLRRVAAYYDLEGIKTVKYAAVHFRGAADSWWNLLGADARATVTDEAALGARLRGRFQPVTAERTARAELYRLEQGGRSVDAYIADFQRLCALVPTAGEDEKLFQFERGLRRDLVEKLRVAGIATLDTAIAMVARVGNLMESVSGRSGSASSGPPARIHQMEEQPDATMMDVRLNRLEATLNAMHQRSQGSDGAPGGFMGLGAKSQTRRGYQQQAAAGGQGGRGRSSSRPARPPPVVPGVSPDVVQQRLANRTCLRCGEDGHNSYACPNAIKSSN